MLKLGLQLKEENEKLEIKLLDPTKKQLSEATENEKMIAQLIKETLDNHLLELLSKNEETKKEN